MRTPIVVDRRAGRAAAPPDLRRSGATGILERPLLARRSDAVHARARGRAARVARHGRHGVRPAHGRGLSRHAARLGHVRVPRPARYARACRRPSARRGARTSRPVRAVGVRGAARAHHVAAARRPRASSISPPTARPSISFRSRSGSASCAVTCRRSARACSSTRRTAPAIPALRDMLAAYLSRSRAVRCDAGQVVVVSGSQQALDLCARVLVDPGDEVAVEEPGLPRRARAVRGAAARACGRCPSMATAWWCRRCRRRRGSSTSRRRTSSRSASRCRWRAGSSSLEWARAHGAVIVEDDYDSEYRYSGAPLPALQGLERRRRRASTSAPSPT